MSIVYIVIGIIILCVFVALINYYSSVPNILKFIILPFTVLFGIYSVYFVYDKLGAPIEGMPEGNFEYVHHVGANRGEQIILWAVKEQRSRLYIFDYSRENMKQLQEANQQIETTNTETISMEMSNGMFTILTDNETIMEIEDDTIKEQPQTTQ